MSADIPLLLRADQGGASASSLLIRAADDDKVHQAFVRLARDLVKIAVIERHSASGNVGLGFIRGFELRRGAIASSVGHDSHNIVVIGASDDDMLAAARAGILQGKNHPDDVEAMTWLFRNFRDFSYLQRAIEQWTVGDRYIFELTALADEMHSSIARGRVSAWQRADWQARVEQINNGATPATEAFSSILGEASRVVLRLLILLNLFTATLLIGLAVLRTRNIVDDRKEGTSVFYRVRDPAVFQLLDVAREIFNNHLIDTHAMLQQLAEEETNA